MRIIRPILTLAVMVAIVYGLYSFVIFPFFFHYVKVVHLVDADTLLVKDGQKLAQVQLIGVDAPEKTGPAHSHQCFDDQARHMTATNFFAQSGEVRLISDDFLGDRDKNGRLLRYMYLKNGDFLNQKILEAGIGKQYLDPNRKYQKQDELAKAQTEAQQKNLGIWDPQGCDGKF